MLTVELLCLQAVKVLTRRTFPLSRKASIVSQKAPIASKKLHL